MPLSISLTEDDFLTALRSFLLAILPNGTEIFQAQNNRVPEPIGPNFIMMTPANRNRLATNEETWDFTSDTSDAIDAKQSTQFMVQLDLHGPTGSDYAQTVSTVTRSSYGCAAFEGTGIQPLFATDGNQMPFKNAENQWENRWTMNIALQGNPIVSTPQDFAASLSVTILGVPA